MGNIPAAEHALVAALLDRYRATFREEHYSGMWLQIFNERHHELHQIFMHGTVDQAAAVLRNPASNYLFYGYDALMLGVTGHSGPDNTELGYLAVALGADKIGNPEAPSTLRYRFGMWRRSILQRLVQSSTETVLQRLDAALGTRVTFPNPYPGETGIITSRGIASYRSIHAIYQASLLHGKVVEIGGGLGRTAYYAARLGIKDYTIVDLPFTAIAQGHFLGQTLGPGHGVRLLTPDEFFASHETYDVALNVDSLTEMSIDTADRYHKEIRRRCASFISINHEANDFTVRKLFGTAAARHPYWLRDGYVEESYRFRKDA